MMKTSDLHQFFSPAEIKELRDSAISTVTQSLFLASSARHATASSSTTGLSSSGSPSMHGIPNSPSTTSANPTELIETLSDVIVPPVVESCRKELDAAQRLLHRVACTQVLEQSLRQSGIRLLDEGRDQSQVLKETLQDIGEHVAQLKDISNVAGGGALEDDSNNSARRSGRGGQQGDNNDDEQCYQALKMLHVVRTNLSMVVDWSVALRDIRYFQFHFAPQGDEDGEEGVTGRQDGSPMSLTDAYHRLRSILKLQQRLQQMNSGSSSGVGAAATSRANSKLQSGARTVSTMFDPFLDKFRVVGRYFTEFIQKELSGAIEAGVDGACELEEREENEEAAADNDDDEHEDIQRHQDIFQDVKFKPPPSTKLICECLRVIALEIAEHEREMSANHSLQSMASFSRHRSIGQLRGDPSLQPPDANPLTPLHRSDFLRTCLVQAVDAFWKAQIEIDMEKDPPMVIVCDEDGFYQSSGEASMVLENMKSALPATIGALEMVYGPVSNATLPFFNDALQALYERTFDVIVTKFVNPEAEVESRVLLDAMNFVSMTWKRELHEGNYVSLIEPVSGKFENLLNRSFHGSSILSAIAKTSSELQSGGAGGGAGHVPGEATLAELDQLAAACLRSSIRGLRGHMKSLATAIVLLCTKPSDDTIAARREDPKSAESVGPMEDRSQHDAFITSGPVDIFKLLTESLAPIVTDTVSKDNGLMKKIAQAAVISLLAYFDECKNIICSYQMVSWFGQKEDETALKTYLERTQQELEKGKKAKPVEAVPFPDTASIWPERPWETDRMKYLCAYLNDLHRIINDIDVIERKFLYVVWEDIEDDATSAPAPPPTEGGTTEGGDVHPPPPSGGAETTESDLLTENPQVSPFEVFSATAPEIRFFYVDELVGHVERFVAPLWYNVFMVGTSVEYGKFEEECQRKKPSAASDGTDESGPDTCFWAYAMPPDFNGGKRLFSDDTTESTHNPLLTILGLYEVFFSDFCQRLMSSGALYVARSAFQMFSLKYFDVLLWSLKTNVLKSITPLVVDCLDRDASWIRDTWKSIFMAATRVEKGLSGDAPPIELASSDAELIQAFCVSPIHLLSALCTASDPTAFQTYVQTFILDAYPDLPTSFVNLIFDHRHDDKKDAMYLSKKQKETLLQVWLDRIRYQERDASGDKPNPEIVRARTVFSLVHVQEVLKKAANGTTAAARKAFFSVPPLMALLHEKFVGQSGRKSAKGPLSKKQKQQVETMSLADFMK